MNKVTLEKKVSKQNVKDGQYYREKRTGNVYMTTLCSEYFLFFVSLHSGKYYIYGTSGDEEEINQRFELIEGRIIIDTNYD